MSRYVSGRSDVSLYCDLVCCAFCECGNFERLLADFELHRGGSQIREIAHDHAHRLCLLHPPPHASLTHELDRKRAKLKRTVAQPHVVNEPGKARVVTANTITDRSTCLPPTIAPRGLRTVPCGAPLWKKRTSPAPS